jgi:signal peptidase I
LVKRIVGLPGDRGDITDGFVYINGVRLHEPYAAGLTYGDMSVVLGKGEYFMMGDNRDESSDSRDFGPVPKKDIIGKVMFRFIPITKLKTF